MKRIFTLSMLFVLVTTMSSAQGYRKWTFTNWSAQTIDNLKADAAASATEGWSDIEKAADVDSPAPDATRNNCFWLTDANGGTAKANGVEIAELEGLDFNSGYTSKRSLAIAVNYPSTALGTYAGAQYLWLGGGGKSVVCFTIPKVAVGQKIVMQVESHKNGDARGVELYVGSIDAEHKIGDSFKPTDLATNTWENWTLPEGVEAPEGVVDIIVYNTSGCHIYSMEVGEESEKTAIAYLYEGDLAADKAYQRISAIESYAVTPIDASQALTQESLTAYSTIVISASVTNTAAIASLKEAHPFVPTLNLNGAIYAAWELGSTADSGSSLAQVSNKNHALLRGIELVEEDVIALPLTNEASYSAVTLAGKFASDEVIATTLEGDAVAIHTHNITHNGYIYLPYSQAALSDAYEASLPLIDNAVKLLVASKAKVSAAPKPSITLSYKHLNTNIILSSTVPSPQIYYTLDGSEPTQQSTLYTEPINVTAPLTVKAVVIGDGYLLSDVAEQAVDIKEQAPQPQINATEENGKTIVTLTSEVEGAQIYYNYTGSDKVTESSLYSAPVVITLNKTIYAFVTTEGKVQSELVQQAIMVPNPQVRIDVLAHMDANAAEYNGGSTSTAYYFSWGKTKTTSFYDPESMVAETLENGNDTVYYTDLTPEEYKDFENGWMIRSRGQLVIWEGLSATSNIGDTNGRNPATVDDIDEYFPITKYFINLADKNTQPADVLFPYNAYITTTQKQAGPFDIVAIIGNGAGEGSKMRLVIQTSTDGYVWESNWQTVGDTIDIVDGQRLYHKFVRSYEGTDEVYVRVYLCMHNSKAQVYDIYLANEGTASQALKDQLTEGIANVTVQPTASKEAIYTLGGVRVEQLQRGINIVRRSDGTTRKVLVK